MKRAEPYQCALANERAVHVDEVGLIHEQAADVPRALHDRDCRAVLLPRCARLNGAERRFPIAPAQQQRPTHEVVLIGGCPTLAPHGAACDEYLDEGGLRLGVLLRGREGLLDCELDGGWQCRRRVRGVRMATATLRPASLQKWHRLGGPLALGASFVSHVHVPGKARSGRRYSHLAHSSVGTRACTTRRCSSGARPKPSSLSASYCSKLDAALS